MITAASRTLCMTDWAAEIGLSVSGLSRRLDAGWDPVEAVITPKGVRRAIRE
jgi:hypothetical protein